MDRSFFNIVSFIFGIAKIGARALGSVFCHFGLPTKVMSTEIFA
jgi:hypothetical protein